MTKKDYVAIAGAILDLRELPTVRDDLDVRLGVSFTVQAIADVCAEGNHRFDRTRFLRACGM